MRQIRVSPDIWELAELEKQRLGLRTEREAIESMVRRYTKLITPAKETSEAPTRSRQQTDSDR